MIFSSSHATWLVGNDEPKTLSLSPLPLFNNELALPQRDH
jgi:hypothetical protein